MKTIFKLAIKNLTRQKRRNFILALALAFGFFVVTSLDSLTSGMVGNLEEQITQLTGGTVLLQGFEKIKSENEGEKSKLVTIVRDKDYIRNLVEDNNIDYKNFSRYSFAAGQMIFNGKKALVQLYGRELSEKDFVNSLQVLSGSLENSLKSDSIILSDKVADSMNVEVGDELIFTTQTVYGQNTVADFTVSAIIKANSFMNAMMAYANLNTVNKLIEIPEDGYTTFTIFLNNKNEQTKIANLIEKKIREDGNNVTSRVEAIKTNPNNPGKGIEKQLRPESQQWEGTKYAVETLYDEVPAIKTVLNVVHIVTTMILLVILLIVMVGVSNTYKMVLYERIREIGTMRALGMDGKSTRMLFSCEAVILCLFGAIAGLILSVFAMVILHMFTITDESLSFFLHNGHFSIKYSAISIIVQYFILIVLTVLAVRSSASKASKLSPAQALRSI